jgi:hypothetical protein
MTAAVPDPFSGGTPMTAAVVSPQAPAPKPAELRLVIVSTPQPPLEHPDRPVSLVRPGVAPPRPPHRPGPRPRPLRGAAAIDDFGPSLSGRADLPDPHVAGRRLLTLALEAMAGRRPMTQVRPLTSLGVYGALSAGRRPGWCSGGTSPLLIGQVRVCEPVDGIAEISAVARRDGRAHAVAARLEGIDGRWRCTALQVG